MQKTRDAKMHDISLVYATDADAWSSYIMEFITPMANVKCISANIQENFEEVVELCKKCLVLVILMSPSMLDDLVLNAERIKPVLKNHSNVVTILCHTSKKDVEENLIKDLPFIDSFKFFCTEDTKEKNREMVAEVLDILSSVQEKPVILPAAKKLPIKAVCPDYITRKEEKIIIVFKREIKGTVQVSFEKNGDRIDAKKMNSYCARFYAPERIKFGKCTFYIYEDGNFVTEWKLYFKSPSLASYESFEFLAQCLGIDSEDRTKIDARLTTLFEESTPGDETLAKFLTPSKMGSVQMKINLRFPTLLHFAAHHGLSELCSCLLDFPGSFSAFVTYNKDGKNPAELAADSGYQELADFLEMFMETEAAISDMGEAYEKMIGHSLYYNEKSTESPAYMEPIPEGGYVTGGISGIRSLYSQGRVTEGPTRQKPPLEKKPVLPPPSREQVKPISTQLERPKPPASLPTLGPSPEEVMGITTPTDPNVFNRFRAEGAPELQFVFPASPLGRSLDELKDIQEGFKKGDFNLDQVQQLYAAWKDRNREGSSSMKERQKQLQELRQKHADILGKAAKGKKQSEIGGFKPRSKGKQAEDELLKIEHIPSTNTYGTFPRSIRRTSNTSLQQRSSTLSTTSSSSSSSSGTRDSAVSCHEMSDDEENFDEPVLLRKNSGMTLGQQLRRSQIETIEEEPPPPPPPRSSAKQSTKAPVVFPRKQSK
ncbi:hypothetical protein ACJMK2_033985 [Sinanodonta woodiana]|uniref:DBB domain-containing protein n=1 Tax=Sinanodonta woodiana TaxID=1069815 RepID=A0ABD3WQ65_SINWO